MTQYLGNQKIISTKEKDGYTHVTLKGDKLKPMIATSLFKLIVTEELQNGTYIQIINDKIGRQFLAKLAEYKIPLSSIQGITQTIINLTNNLFNISVGEKYGYGHKDEITMEDILNTKKEIKD